jgi:OFA family oxalate/formate antiporter-like MFS transporter
VFLVGGYLVSSTATAESIHLIYIAYGVFVGTASGMAHNAILGCTNNWFPDRVGTSSGALTLGFGIGSLVLGPLVGLGIERMGWQAAFVFLGLVTAMVVVAGSTIVRYPHPDQVLPAPTSHTHKGDRQKKNARTTPSGLNFTTRQMLRTAPFYLAFVASVFLASVYLATMGSAKLIALEMGAVAALATLMVGFVSAGDGVGRLTSGLLFDRVGYRISFVLVAVLFTASATLLYAAYVLALLPLVGAGFVLLGMGFGALSTVLAAVTNRFYGPKNYGSNLSVAYLDFVPASLIGPPLVGFMQTTTGSFQDGFLFLAALGIAGLVLTLFIFPPQKVPSIKP